MKTQLLKATLVTACALITMVALTATGGGQGGKLEGVWNVTVKVCNNGPTATRLNTFMFGARCRNLLLWSRRSSPCDAVRATAFGSIQTAQITLTLLNFSSLTPT